MYLISKEMKQWAQLGNVWDSSSKSLLYVLGEYIHVIFKSFRLSSQMNSCFRNMLIRQKLKQKFMHGLSKMLFLKSVGFLRQTSKLVTKQFIRIS